MKKLTHSNTAQHNRRCKDKVFEAQIKATYKAFKTPSTMLMVSVQTGILRANICRYVAILSKQGKIKLVSKGKCHISKHQANFYTTDLASNDILTTHSIPLIPFPNCSKTEVVQ